MATTLTTLSGAVAVNDLVINVGSVTNGAVGNLIKIDGEYMIQSAAANGTAIPVMRRGDQGTAVTTHVSGATVEFGLPSDFGVAPAGSGTITPASPNWGRMTVVATGAITVPLTNQNMYVELLGTTTNAYTLADPLPSQEGQELTIQAGAAHAYTVGALDSTGAVSTNSFNGSAADTDLATFSGNLGDSFRVKALNLAGSMAWVVQYLHSVTLSDS